MDESQRSDQSKLNYYSAKYYSGFIESLYYEDGDGEISIY